MTLPTRLLAAALAGAILSQAPARAEEPQGLGLPGPLDRLARGLFVGPLRYRHEYRDDHDLREDKDDGDNRDLLKLNFGVDARPVDAFRARVALRYTRTWGRNKVDHSLRLDPFGQDHLDLFEAFGEIGPLPDFPLSLRAGRQVLTYGEERLVGPLEFIQNARTWDALRLLYAKDNLSVDAWWGRRVQFVGPDNHQFNKPIDTVDFFGIYASAKPVPGVTFEPFLLVKYDDNSKVTGETGKVAHHVIRYSPGARAVWKAPQDLTFSGDAVIQFGDRGEDPILAWGIATKAVWRAPEKIRPFYELEVEFIHGSGDANPKDGHAGTFDNFYPTNHKFYGEIDFVSWQNVSDLELTTRWEIYRLKLRDPPPEGAAKGPKSYLWERILPGLAPPVVPIVLETGFHAFWLAARKDAWYNAALGVIRRDPKGESGRDLGREVDLVLRAGPLSVGYAHFFPGEFVERTNPKGGRVSGADLFYLELAFWF